MPRIKERTELSHAAKHTVSKHGEDLCIEVREMFEDMSIAQIAAEKKLTNDQVSNILEAGRQLKQIEESNRPETNVEFMNRIMEDGRLGPLIQMFVMDTIGRTAKHIASMTVEQLRKEMGSAVNFINPDAWHATAVTINKEFEEKYK